MPNFTMPPSKQNKAMLEQDLALHKARLAELKDPNFGKSKTRKGGLHMDSNINIPMVIASYETIIKSIEAELKGKN